MLNPNSLNPDPEDQPMPENEMPVSDGQVVLPDSEMSDGAPGDVYPEAQVALANEQATLLADIAPQRRRRFGAFVLDGVLRRNRHASQALPEADPADQHVIKAFESKRFVREGPLLKDIAFDTTRENKYFYYPDKQSTRSRDLEGKLYDTPSIELKEHEGLLETYNFLQKIKQLAKDANAAPDTELADAAKNADRILENTQFMGEREIDEATKGFAALWKSYLREDTKRKLCVPAGVIGMGEEIRKSSDYLFDRVMGHFSEAERKAFGPRIVRDLNSISPRDEQAKIILLDDWSIKGTQLSRGMNHISLNRRDGRKGLEQVEVHLVAASSEQLEGQQIQDRKVPILAYFKGENPTGTHSSVDRNYEDDIEKMVRAADAADPNANYMMPPMTNIVRGYR